MGYLELMYSDGQATLDEIMMYFPNHNIYILDVYTSFEMIAVVEPSGNVLVTFEPLEDAVDTPDGTPKVYQMYDTNYDNVKFSEVAHLWADTITKICEVR